MSPAQPGGSWLASQGRLPLGFMGLGLAWLATAAGLTALRSDLLGAPHIAPAVIAVTHAWVLGFFLTIAVGAMYQLAPVALGTTLWSERLGWLHLALHGVAVPVMVFAFWQWRLPLLGAAGVVLLVGISSFAVNSLATVWRSGKRDAVAWSLALATSWLVVTVLAGLGLVANRLWALWPGDPLPLLRAHAHLGLVGFFLTLLQGVTFRLVPMFTLGVVPDWRPVKAGLWLSQLGLVALAPALAWSQSGVAFAAGLAIAAGIGASAWALRATFATRKKQVLDTGMRAFVQGGAALAVAAAVGVWLACPATHAGSMPGGLSANVYGVLLLLGGFLPAITGMLNKIVPFLTWMRAYGPRVGRVPTPPATALADLRLDRWAMRLQATALVPLLLGAWTLRPAWLVAGALLLLGAIALFLVNMGRVLRHLWRPVTPALNPRPNPLS